MVLSNDELFKKAQGNFDYYYPPQMHLKSSIIAFSFHFFVRVAENTYFFWFKIDYIVGGSLTLK